MCAAGWPETRSGLGERALGWAAGVSAVLLVVAVFSSAGDALAFTTALVGVTGYAVALPAVLLSTRNAPASPFPPVRTVLSGAVAVLLAVIVVTSGLWGRDPWPALPITVALGLPLAGIPVFAGGLIARHVTRGPAVALTVAGVTATVWAVVVATGMVG